MVSKVSISDWSGCGKQLSNGIYSLMQIGLLQYAWDGPSCIHIRLVGIWETALKWYLTFYANWFVTTCLEWSKYCPYKIAWDVGNILSNSLALNLIDLA